MNITTLEIGGIVIPAQSLGDFQQDYEELEAKTPRRTAAGSSVVRRLWGDKLRTTVRGRGWAPSGLDGLNKAATHTLKCAMPRAISSTSPSITIPATRRSDANHTPRGWALVDGELVETTINNITNNVATLQTVTGAVGYRVTYYPELTVHVLTLTERGANEDGTYEWSLEAEEI